MKRHFLFFAALTLSVGLSAETTQQTDHIGTGTTITTNGGGQIPGTNLYYYQWYEGGSASASMTYYPDGTFSSNFNNVSEYQAETGLHYNNNGVDPTQYDFIIDYAFTKTGSVDYGYVGSYGWMSDPTINYYVIDDWYDYRPGSWLGTYKGSYTADDDTYDVYIDQITDRLYSVRKTARQSGQISLSSHFKEWESIGVSGKPVRVNFVIYAFKGTGTIDLTKLEISEHGSEAAIIFPTQDTKHQTQKYLHNGVLVIDRNGQHYSATGQKLR